MATLNAWIEKCNLHPLVECEAFSDALKVENPNLRAEVIIVIENDFVTKKLMLLCILSMMLNIMIFENCTIYNCMSTNFLKSRILIKYHLSI